MFTLTHSSVVLFTYVAIRFEGSDCQVLEKHVYALLIVKRNGHRLAWGRNMYKSLCPQNTDQGAQGENNHPPSAL